MGYLLAIYENWTCSDASPVLHFLITHCDTLGMILILHCLFRTILFLNHKCKEESFDKQ
jgi:hypothetical protein